MPVAFDTVPNTLRVPWAYVEITNEAALSISPSQPYRTLIFGQRLATGTAPPLVPVRIRSAAQARALFGTGSQLAHVSERYFDSNTTTETWAIPLDDLPAGVAASGGIDFAGTDVQAGTANLYIGGRRVTFGVGQGASAADVATACADAINANMNLPVTATAAAGSVAIDCRWTGETGNRIDLRFNARAGEELPANLITTITPMAGGAGNPDLAPAIALMGDAQHNIVITPFIDTANVQALVDELEERNSALVQKEGQAIAGEDASLAALATLGTRFNSRFLSIVGWEGSPTPPYEIAAVVGALAAYHGQLDPGRPFQTLPLRGVMAPDESRRFEAKERNALLYDGISTIVTGPGDQPQLERLITTYRLDQFGESDPSYLDVPVMLTLSLMRYESRTMPLRKFPRHKLGDDGRRYGEGQPIVTPSIMRAEYIALARSWEFRALAENSDAFAKSIIVERNLQDRNRMDVSLSPDVINQFMILGVRMPFVL